jgi:4-hydroxymandelate oxidase
MELLRRLEDRAREVLPEAVFDYCAGGAGDEVTLAENAQAWQRLWLRPRQLRGVASADPAVELLGARVAAPIVLAPAASQRLLHPDGELAVARAAAGAGLLTCLSTRATADLAEVAAAAPGAPRWFQLYVSDDHGLARDQLARARAHGYRAVVLTVDLPVAGRRERELRHGPLELPDGVRLATHLGGDRPAASKPSVGGWTALGWDDLGWIGDAAGLPLLLKGILTGEDALTAVEAGVAGVVVSNHGGRQLDGCVPTAVALPEVVGAVAGRAAVLVDGGIRSGADVARALALGADAAMVGRPYLWALAAGGQDGVAAVLGALVADLERCLVLLGVGGPGELGAQHLRPRAW